LADWHSHARQYLRENTEDWTKEERSRRINICFGNFGASDFADELLGQGLRLATVLGLISAGGARLQVKR
jgi:hypothetical protein